MKVLDLFCGAGGAAMGIHHVFPDAEIVGIDIKPQPRYPFTFCCGDVMALDFARMNANFIWASPPCQHYTQMLNHGLTERSKHPDLIDPIRKWLIATGVPYIIENVAGAPLINPVMLCGEMFKLRVIRHRFFESCLKLKVPAHLVHDPRGAIRKQRDGGYYYRVYGHETGKAEWGKAMGIDWMKSPELAQAIPPAYSEFLVNQWKASQSQPSVKEK